MASEEFDIDEFLASNTAGHLQELLVHTIYKGIMKAFWTILLIQVALGVLIVALSLSAGP